MEIFAIVAVLLTVIAFIVWRYRKARTPSEDSSEIIQPPPVDQNVSEEEGFFRAAQRVADQALNEEIDAANAHSDEIEPLRQRATIAFKRLEESGVADAATDILGEIWHWPSWMKQDGWTMPVALPEFEGGDLDSLDGGYKKRQWYRWQRGETRYTLVFEPRHNHFPADDEYAQLKVIQDDKLMADFNLSQKLSEEYDRWHALGLDAFTPGQWMVELNELAAEIEAANRARRRQQDQEFYANRASRINLD